MTALDEKVVETVDTTSSSMTDIGELKESGKPTTESQYAASASSTSEDDSSDNSDPLAPLELALTANQETEFERMATASKIRTATSIGTTGSRPADFEVDFEPGDKENPLNWSLWYRGMVIGFCSFATWSVVVYSTSYTSGITGMEDEFNEDSEPIVTLGVTTYLFGLAIGSLILAPLSEIFGRRPVYAGSMLVYTLLVIPCALADSLSTIIVVRFFGAVAGSAMIANAPGTIADISDEAHRALAFSVWSLGPMNGPVTGPIIGGFTSQYLGWRWTNWLVLILGAVGWIMMMIVEETYAPAILKRKAARMRKETGDDRWWCRYDQRSSLWTILKVNLSRPLILTLTEPILWFWDLYVSVVYGILYLCFVAYPIIFNDNRGWSLSLGGLAFLGVGIGSVMVVILEPFIRRMINSHPKDPETGRVKPEASVSVICVAAVLIPLGQLIFSWTSLPTSIPWIVCLLAGIPFGAGNTIVFIYASNYLAGSYGIYAASALAGNSVIRSIFGGTLPLAGPSMYAAMTPQWAGTFLGLLEVILIPIPFVFYKWGDKIRKRSPVIKQMRDDQERMAQRAQKAAARLARRAAKAAAEGGEEDILAGAPAVDLEQGGNVEDIPEKVE